MSEAHEQAISYINLGNATTGIGNYLDALDQPIMRDRNVRVAALEVGKLDYVEEVSKRFKDRLNRTAPVTGIPNQRRPPFNQIAVMNRPK